MSDLDRYIDEAIDKLSPEAIDKFLTKMCKKNEKRANKKAEPEAEPEAAENSQSNHAVTINHAEHVEEVEADERCLDEQAKSSVPSDDDAESNTANLLGSTKALADSVQAVPERTNEINTQDK